jgi:hypothetical protein
MSSVYIDCYSHILTIIEASMNIYCSGSRDLIDEWSSYIAVQYMELAVSCRYTKTDILQHCYTYAS